MNPFDPAQTRPVWDRVLCRPAPDASPPTPEHTVNLRAAGPAPRTCGAPPLLLLLCAGLMLACLRPRRSAEAVYPTEGAPTS